MLRSGFQEIRSVYVNVVHQTFNINCKHTHTEFKYFSLNDSGASKMQSAGQLWYLTGFLWPQTTDLEVWHSMAKIFNLNNQVRFEHAIFLFMLLLANSFEE